MGDWVHGWKGRPKHEDSRSETKTREKKPRGKDVVVLLEREFIRRALSE